MKAALLSTMSSAASSPNSCQGDNTYTTYIVLVPRGLEHIVEKMVQSQLSSHSFVETKLVGEELAKEKIHMFISELRDQLKERQVKENKKRRRKLSIEGTHAAAVGTIQVAPNKHVSIGYCRETSDVWTLAGQLQGTVWMKFYTNAPVVAVANIRCLGPLLALIDIYEGINLDEGQSLEEATRRIQQATAGDSYSVKFQSALRLWHRHVQECWSTADRNGAAKEIANGTTPLKYRLSCMRNESNKYQYTRRQLLTSAHTVLPSQYSQWSVDLENYDVEIVLLQRSHCLTIGLALRPYQLLQARSFASGVLPPDVSPPYLSGTALAGLVRLRPTTAHVLLHLAQLQEGDIVVDPCSGIGTIPIEAHIRSNTIFGIGGDLVMTDPTLSSLSRNYSLKASKRRNSDEFIKKKDAGCPGGKAAELVAWDAISLPIRSQTVDVVVSDLPFGQQCMSASRLDAFLPLILAEMARILRATTGRMVILCGSYVPILEALKHANDSANTDTPVWKLPCTAVFPVNVGGNLAWVVQAQRGSSEAARLPRHSEEAKKQVSKRERTDNLIKNGKAGTLKRPQA
jgi:Putative RNA methylase family UPF0020